MGKKNPASKNPNRFFPSKDNSLDVMSIFANNRSTQWSIPSPYKPLNTCTWRCLQPPPCGGLVAESCPALATPWTVARQAPLSMGFSRQEYWTGLPCPPPGDLPDPKIPRSPALQADSLLSEPPGANLQSILPQNKRLWIKRFLNKALVQRYTIKRKISLLTEWKTGPCSEKAKCSWTCLHTADPFICLFKTMSENNICFYWRWILKQRKIKNQLTPPPPACSHAHTQTHTYIFQFTDRSEPSHPQLPVCDTLACTRIKWYAHKPSGCFCQTQQCPSLGERIGKVRLPLGWNVWI